MSSRLLSPTDLDPGDNKPNLISTYHSGKDIAFSIDRMGNVRSFDPKYTVANGLGKPVGFLELRKGDEGYWIYRAVHLATGKAGDWTAMRLQALLWLADRVREQRYGAKRT